MKKVILALSAFFFSGAIQAQVKITSTPALNAVNSSAMSLTNTNVVIGNTGYTGAVSGNNTVIGSSAASSGFSGIESVIIGTGAGSNPSNAGGSNTFVGHWSGGQNTTGWGNTFIGQLSGGQNTTGYGNTFLGRWAGTTTQTGASNTMLGIFSGTYNTTGDSNSFVGQRSGFGNSTGKGNTLMGASAGLANTQGNFNMAIGLKADFGSGSLVNATAIGSNSLVGLSNSMVLGGKYNSGFDVNVGIGTDAPIVHLHLLNKNQEDVIFSTIEPTYKASSRLRLQTLTTIGGMNSTMTLMMNGKNTPGDILMAIPGIAPRVPYVNMGMLVTESSAPLTIGSNGYNNATANTHFITSLYNGSGSFTPWECMRVNDSNGFVGIHTRTAVTGGGLGDPQALFHVNLTNPGQGNLNTLVNGIRFEGLPSAAHPNVVVIDAKGNLATRSIDSIGSLLNWKTFGNNTSGMEFIGTLKDDDFRIYTNNQLRARVTSTGSGTMSDFDFGTNTFVAANNSAGFGINNNVRNVTNSMAIGMGNTLYFADHSAIIGQRNALQNTSLSSMIVGEDNVMTHCISTIEAGSRNNMIASSESIVGGTGHVITQSPQSATVGDHHIMADAWQSFSTGVGNAIKVSIGGNALGSSNSITSSNNTIVAGQSNSSMGANGSGALGMRNTVAASQAAFAIGSGNLIQNGASGNTSDSSVAVGGGNRILGSRGAFVGGTGNIIQDATNIGCAAIGAGNVITGSNESVAAGEQNIIQNGHGVFVAGGHNLSDGRYNVAIGRRLIASATAPPIGAGPSGEDLIMVIGDQINNNLKNSLAVGFNGNRTMTVTERGVSIQVQSPTMSYPTYNPRYNLEVNANPAGSPVPVGSNIAFYDLPMAPHPMSAVLVDANGELYQSNNSYAIWNPGTGSPVITDAKLNTHTAAITDALQLISKMQPKKYQVNATGYAELNIPANKETYGLVAQELEPVLPTLVKDISLNNKTVKGVNYTEVIPILVQAVKDQQVEIEQLKAQTEAIKLLQKQIEELKSLVANDVSKAQTESIAQLNITLADKEVMVLGQNVPNPADKVTTIGFYIPASIKNASIRFATIDGKAIQSLSVAERGKGVVKVYTSELNAGVYIYTLIADGKTIDTKRMEILR